MSEKFSRNTELLTLVKNKNVSQRGLFQGHFFLQSIFFRCQHVFQQSAIRVAAFQTVTTMNSGTEKMLPSAFIGHFSAPGSVGDQNR